MLKKFITTFLLVSVLCLCGCTYNSQHSTSYSHSIVLRLANNLSPEHPTSVACDKFAELVEEYTDGEIRIICYHDSQLGSESSTIEQLEIGGIDFVRTSISSLTDIEPSFNVLSLPYLYENDTHMWNVLNGNIGKYLLSTSNLSEHNISGLCWYTAGSRCFYSNSPLDNGIESLKGMRIRSLESQLFQDTISELGAEPLTIPFADVYSAILLNDVDGAENNFPSYVSSKHYQVAPYIILDEHFRLPEMIVAAETTMKSLTQEQRNIIRKAARETTDLQIQLWNDYEQQAIGEAIDNSCIIINPTEQQKMEFKSAVKELKEKYTENYSDLMQKIENTPAE
ncbi:MAG: TRAP transporter substrate-binding protein [Oscillospiraceae bacterium]